MSNSPSESPPYFITEPLRSFTPIQLANGDLRMAIAKAGQHAYNSWGEEATLTEEFLSKDYRTWEGGLLSTNHENTNDLINSASLYDLEWDSDKKLVITSFANLPDKAKAFINSDFYQGLSQECIPLQFKKDSFDVIKGYGTGCTIVMWPHSPAATPEMGVGVRPALAAILASKYPTQKITDDSMTDNKPGGGTPAISTEAYESIALEKVELKSTIMALESEKKVMETELASWKSKYTELESGESKRNEIAISDARKTWDAELKATSEKEAAVTDLKTVMSEEAATGYLATNPSVDQIKSIANILKANSSGEVGSSHSFEPTEKVSSGVKLRPNPETGKLEVI